MIDPPRVRRPRFTDWLIRYAFYGSLGAATLVSGSLALLFEESSLLPVRASFLSGLALRLHGLGYSGLGLSMIAHGLIHREVFRPRVRLVRNVALGVFCVLFPLSIALGVYAMLSGHRL